MSNINKTKIIQKLDEASESKQLNIFRDVYGAEKENASNLFLNWDFHPIYCVSRKAQSIIKKNKKSETLPILTHQYEINGKPYELHITPAQIEDGDGSTHFSYPSNREEIIEHVLRRLFMKYFQGVHIPRDSTWIRFTLKQLKSELNEVGHDTTLQRIKESLDIMLKCSIKITDGQKRTYEGGIFLTKLTVNREEYNRDGRSLWAVRLNDLISRDLEVLDIRQYNSGIFLRSKFSLTRWIYKLLVNQYKNANHNNSFKLKASSLIANYRIDYKQDRDAWKVIRKSLIELKDIKNITGKNAVIREDFEGQNLSINEIPVLAGRKKIDIVFEILPSKTFIDYMKACNAKNKKIKNN